MPRGCGRISLQDNNPNSRQPFQAVMPSKIFRSNPRQNKSKYENTPARHQRRLLVQCKLMCALLALTAPLAAKAQQTVFSDTFGSSTLNQTNAFPGGTPTASSTSYTVASPKAVTATSVAPGHLLLITPSTSSANTEIQAMFTKNPVSLASIGDYIEMTYTFTDRSNQMNNLGGNGSGFHMGLYNSGGTPPLGWDSSLELGNGKLEPPPTSAAFQTGWVSRAHEFFTNRRKRLVTRNKARANDCTKHRPGTVVQR